MSSPCWVDKAGPVLAYRTMHLFILLLYIRYNVCLSQSSIISLHHRYCCLPHTTCILVIVQNITTLLLLLCILVYCITAVCRGSVIIELISRMNSQLGCWVCLKSKKTYFLGGGLMRNTYTRYHICLMRVKGRRVSLKRWFDVKYSSCRRTSCLLGVLH